MLEFFGSIFYGIVLFIGGVMALPIPFLIVVVMMGISSMLLYGIIKRILR